MHRLDQYLVESGLFVSRTKAVEAVKRGKVLVNKKTISKPSFKVAESDVVEVQEDEISFVSRAGLKLYEAIKYYQVDLNGLTALDIGASTGGFTDCMLKHGAGKVYAVDVGRNQLAPLIQSDDRVVSMESVNARYMEKELFDDVIDFVTVDVSFISLKLIIPAIEKVLPIGGKVIALIKPQFEVGKKRLPKNGVVKTEADRERAVNSVLSEFKEFGFSCSDVIKSPIRGSKGNIEYLVLCEKKMSI